MTGIDNRAVFSNFFKGGGEARLRFQEIRGGGKNIARVTNAPCVPCVPCVPCAPPLNSPQDSLHG